MKTIAIVCPCCGHGANANKSDDPRHVDVYRCEYCRRLCEVEFNAQKRIVGLKAYRPKTLTARQKMRMIGR